MPSYPNPVLRSVAIRTIGPFVPVWLFGTVFGLALGLWGPDGGYDRVQLLAFLGFYTLLVFALVLAFFLRQYQSSPESLEIDVDGITGAVHRRGANAGPQRLAIPYDRISSLSAGGLFGWRIEGRPTGSERLDWFNLTAENAGHVADALTAWRSRQATTALPTGSE